MVHNVHFYDSSAPMNVPGGVYAACYVNGYAWSEAEMKRMGHIFRVSVLREPWWAKYARCLDVENFAALPSDLPPFIRERRSLGYNDSTAYVNRDNWQTCIDEVDNAKLPHPLWWVATLDGTQKVEHPNAVAWAVQYYGGGNAPYDLSILWGVNNFVRP